MLFEWENENLHHWNMQGRWWEYLHCVMSQMKTILVHWCNLLTSMMQMKIGSTVTMLLDAKTNLRILPSQVKPNPSKENHGEKQPRMENNGLPSSLHEIRFHPLFNLTNLNVNISIWLQKCLPRCLKPPGAKWHGSASGTKVYLSLKNCALKAHPKTHLPFTIPPITPPLPPNLFYLFLCITFLDYYGIRFCWVKVDCHCMCSGKGLSCCEHGQIWVWIWCRLFKKHGF